MPVTVQSPLAHWRAKLIYEKVHGPPFGPKYPVLQEQFESVALPLGELVSLGHTRHAASSVAPVLVEYLPAPQSVHATLPLVVLYLPAMHRVQLPASAL